jgi:RNA polymerase sigma-70 factor (ECF subfamily)
VESQDAGLEEKSVNNERFLIIALKNGDASAFDEVFRNYGKRLYHFALGYLKSSADAEEIAQEVFMKIWRNRAALDPDLSFSAYVFKIAYRDIALQLRRIMRRQAYCHETLESFHPSVENLDERTDYHILIARIEKLVGKLPDRQREVFTLHKIEGLPVAEVAQKLGIASKTAENHFTQAMKSLKSYFNQEFPEGMIFFMMLFQDR